MVDRYRDQIFEHLLAGMTAEPSQVAPHMQFILATRYLERIADHATNIAEDIIFWVRGLDVRHGRARINVEEVNYPEKRSLNCAAQFLCAIESDLRVAYPPRAGAPLASAHPPFCGNCTQNRAVCNSFGFYVGSFTL